MMWQVPKPFNAHRQDAEHSAGIRMDHLGLPIRSLSAAPNRFDSLKNLAHQWLTGQNRSAMLRI
jgi:hypothetical protein